MAFPQTIEFSIKKKIDIVFAASTIFTSHDLPAARSDLLRESLSRTVRRKRFLPSAIPERKSSSKMHCFLPESSTFLFFTIPLFISKFFYWRWTVTSLLRVWKLEMLFKFLRMALDIVCYSKKSWIVNNHKLILAFYELQRIAIFFTMHLAFYDLVYRKTVIFFEKYFIWCI